MYLGTYLKAPSLHYCTVVGTCKIEPSGEQPSNSKILYTIHTC